MKRKALLIGNTRGLIDTPIDMFRMAKFLMSNQGGAWEPDELVYLPDKSVDMLMQSIDNVGKEHNDYVFVYFTGHGGLQGNTIIEVNHERELLIEKYLFGLAERQLNVLDCCRSVVTTPLNIYGSSRGMSQLEKDIRKVVRKEYEDLVMGAAPQLVRMYSCSEGETSYGTGKYGSYYSNNLIGCITELLKSNDVIRIYQWHKSVAIKTAADVLKDIQTNQHPTIIPAKCMEQLELPIGYNPIVLQS